MSRQSWAKLCACIAACAWLAFPAQAKVDFCGSSSKADVPLYNSSTRMIAVWCDGNPADSILLGPVADCYYAGALCWTPLGIANFTGGAVSDVLLEDYGGWMSIWPGGNSAAGVITGRIAGYGLRVVRSYGDFNGDGRDDVVVYSPETRVVIVWYSANGSTIAVLGQFSPGWTPFHVADVDGDGHADLILRETDSTGAGTGRYSYWPAGNPANYRMMTTPGFPWELMATGKFRSGPQACDVLWYNAYSAEMATSADCSAATLSLAPIGILGWPVFPLMAEDMNGDGFTDLVTVHFNNHTISMMNGGDSSTLTALGQWAQDTGWAPLFQGYYWLPYEVHYW